MKGRKARQNFKEMLKHKNALTNMLIYIFFVTLIIIVATYRATDFEIYDMKKLMTDLIVDEEFYVEDTHIYKSMMDVATEEYLRGPFIGNLFPEDCYQNKIAANYRNNYLVGMMSADSLKQRSIMRRFVC